MRRRRTEVAPRLAVVRRDRLEKDVCIADGAELAVCRSCIVDKFAAEHGLVGLHVLPTCLAGEGLEDDEFAVGAVDGAVCETDRQHAADEIGKGRQAVHEDPEAGEVGGLGKDTAEEQTERNIKLAMLPPFSADSTPAMTMCVKVEVKMRNIQTKRKSWKPRR
jgi:hypothetical protein